MQKSVRAEQQFRKAFSFLFPSNLNLVPVSLEQNISQSLQPKLQKESLTLPSI